MIINRQTVSQKVGQKVGRLTEIELELLNANLAFAR